MAATPQMGSSQVLPIDRPGLGIVIHGADARVLVANRVACAMLGLSAQALLDKTPGDSCWSFVREDGTHLPSNEHPVFRALDEHRPVKGVVLGVGNQTTGETVWMLVSAYPELEPEGGVSRVVVSLVDVTEEARAEVSDKRLAGLFRTAHTVRRLIIREGDRDRLLQQACELLIKTRGYHSAWVAMQDESGRLCFSSESGLGDRFDAMRTQMENGTWPGCFREAQSEGDRVVVHRAATVCETCTLGSAYGEAAALTGLLRHGGRDYGMLAVCLPPAVAADPDEVALFGEVVVDLGFALQAIETRAELDRAAEELRFHRSLLEETGRIAGVGGWSFDPVTGEGCWTDEVARIHDLDPAAPTSRDIALQYYTEGSKPRIAAAIADAVERGLPYDLELEIESAKGIHKWVRTIGHPVVEDGRVVRVAGSFQDITARKQRETRLHESEERYRGLFENMVEGYAYCRMIFEHGEPVDWVYLAVNEARPQSDVHVRLRGRDRPGPRHHQRRNGVLAQAVLHERPRGACEYPTWACQAVATRGLSLQRHGPRGSCGSHNPVID